MKRSDLLQKIVVIEIIIFILVIAFLWVEEIFDLPYLLLNAEPTPVNYKECMMETVVFILIFGLLIFYSANVTLQISKLESFIRICASCH